MSRGWTFYFLEPEYAKLSLTERKGPPLPSITSTLQVTPTALTSSETPPTVRLH